jgi:regulation of enolase protein 1 (concanavalin A-like superfamily)
MKKATTLVVSLLALVLAGFAFAASPLDDDFNAPSLDPKWTVSVLGDAQLQEHSAKVENGKLVLVSAGRDIWDDNDNGIYVWQAATGDFRITLKLERLDETDASAKLGIMIRQDLDIHAPNVFAMAMPKGIHIQGRDTRGGSTGPVSTGRIEWPDRGQSTIWVRVTRTGDDFKQEASYDGKEWVSTHDEANRWKDIRTVKLPRTVLVGIAMTSHQSTTTTTGIVDDFVFEQLGDGPPPGTGFVVPDAVDEQGNTQPGGVVLYRENKPLGSGYSGTPFLVEVGDVTASTGGPFIKATPASGKVLEGKTLHLAIRVSKTASLVKDLSTSAGQAWVIKLPVDPSEDYSAPGASEADFVEYEVPSNWDSIDPTNNIYGWIRTKVTVPKEYVGKDLWLVDWNLDDEDWTYWNGTLIGHTNSWNSPRQYVIPGALVQETNVLAIRGRDGTGEGGISMWAPKLLAGNPSVGIVGQIKDPEGKPLPGVPVRVESPVNEWGPTTVTVTTDASGKYAAYGMGPGEFTVSIASPAVVAEPSSKSFRAEGGQTVSQDFTARFIPFFPDPVDTKASDDFAGTKLDPKWTAQDIGDTEPGRASVSNKVLTITANGADFWDAEDRGYIVYQKYSGDFVATVKVTSVPTTNDWSKAGIDIRASNQTGAVHVFTCATLNNGVAAQGRSVADTTNQFNVNTGGPFQPVYLRVEKKGDRIRSFWSPDGKVVNYLGEINLQPLAGEVLVALAVTSHAAGTLGTATFEDFRIGGIPAVAPPAPAVKLGDVNGDGKVGIPDATLALQIAVGILKPTSEQIAAGDINKNGKIDIPDVTKILRAAVGLEKLGE